LYPLQPGAQAFPGNQITLDPDNVPLPPPAQAATDSLVTVSSAVTGLEFGEGTYRIQGLPPGQYLIEIQEIDSDAVEGSSIGPLSKQLTIPVPEFYNGAAESGESADSPAEFSGVTVIAGQVTSGIDIILNGIASTGLAPVTEQEPNNVKKKEQRLNLSVAVSGSATSTDEAKLRINIGGTNDFIEDLYRITIDQRRVIFIALDPTSGAGDLDLYLFSTGVSKKKTSLEDPNLLSFSAGPTSSELIAIQLEPGTYIIGLSAFEGSIGYRLRLITSQ
jgi:hypothetical protein